MPLQPFQQEFARFLVETESLFFRTGLVLKDGRPSPYFVNMGKFSTGRLSLRLGSFFARFLAGSNRLPEVDIILGPSYKGSAIAQATAISLWQEHRQDRAFEYDRKEVKAYGEASGQKNIMVNNTFFDGCGLWIVDDVGTSMATKYDLLEKIERERVSKNISLRVVGLCLGVDRQQTTACYDEENRIIPGKKGEDAIRKFTEKTGIPVFALAPISEVMQYLFEEQIPILIEGNRHPLSPSLKKTFDGYLEEYGTPA
jgi:orotate phosphoribosyltransferase